MTRRYDSPLPAELTPGQLTLYHAIAHGPRSSQAGLVPITDDDGRLLGPFAAMAISPALGEAVQALGAAIRFSTSLPPTVRELAILMVAVRRDCAFEWIAHERAATAAGLTRSQLEALARGARPDDLDTAEAAAWTVMGALCSRGGLDEAEFAAAIAVLGDTQLVELVWLHGYYSMLADALGTFDPQSLSAAREAAGRAEPRG